MFNSHTIIWFAALILFLIFFMYVYFVNHRDHVVNDEIINAFLKAGLTQSQINDLTYDAEVWYYKGDQTCVSYGGTVGEWCDPSNFVCDNFNKTGDFDFQGRQLKLALDNGGMNPNCPLF